MSGLIPAYYKMGNGNKKLEVPLCEAGNASPPAPLTQECEARLITTASHNTTSVVSACLDTLSQLRKKPYTSDGLEKGYPGQYANPLSPFGMNGFLVAVPLRALGHQWCRFALSLHKREGKTATVSQWLFCGTSKQGDKDKKPLCSRDTRRPCAGMARREPRMHVGLIGYESMEGEWRQHHAVGVAGQVPIPASSMDQLGLSSILASSPNSGHGLSCKQSTWKMEGKMGHVSYTKLSGITSNPDIHRFSRDLLYHQGVLEQDTDLG
ncbi:hypothetical protein WISP_30893 [Willisornis vidua]|uniref:Uncharacterized protein n=1 Tax=Willisornis vidua TaxID=1566151 RepID=A0ABQ9DQZ6_9PASS|nr:hypothetical protein WISP_30893 [Willisornis vidua]